MSDASPAALRLCADAAGIERAGRILKAGGLVAFPTETVYGLGADAFNAAALARVFEVKKRPFFDPLIVHIAAAETLRRLVDFARLEARAEERLHTLIGAFWPGPLTLVLPKLPEVPGLATAGLDTVAVRFPSHKAARALIEQSTGALAAPSANPFGRLSPTRAEHVAAGRGGSIDAILDGGASSIGVESTVLDISGGEPALLRYGGIACEDIESRIGKVRPAGTEEAADGSAARAPGGLRGHYAPKTALLLFERHAAPPPLLPGDALVFQSRAEHPHSDGAVFFLSGTGECACAAANLFETLHRLDRGGWTRIIVEKAADEGIGKAINDRLRRGAERAGGGQRNVTP
jgi:L-threonylcarbamoyladenylate synthase